MPGKRRDRILRWAERLLLIAGLAMLGWCAVVAGDAIVSQRLARRSIEVAVHGRDPVYRTPDKGSFDRPPVRKLVRGSALAELSIPRVRLSAVVLHGSDSQTLRRGPGHLENTAVPGESGNIVIAGHRDSFFRPLRNLQLGDDIFLETFEGRHHYRVVALGVVGPHDLSVLEPADEPFLTLITCYPFWVLGPAPDRFVVRAAGVVHPTGPDFATPVARPYEPLPAPVAHPPSSNRSIVKSPENAGQENELVQEAVERFRRVYNARLVTHRAAQAGQPLKFQRCDVAIGLLQSTATCRVSPGRSDDGEPPPSVWTFTLERDENTWAIRSIVADDHR